jgi:hypothetical protein
MSQFLLVMRRFGLCAAEAAGEACASAAIGVYHLDHALGAVCG